MVAGRRRRKVAEAPQGQVTLGGGKDIVRASKPESRVVPSSCNWQSSCSSCCCKVRGSACTQVPRVRARLAMRSVIVWTNASSALDPVVLSIAALLQVIWRCMTALPYHNLGGGSLLLLSLTTRACTLGTGKVM